MNSFKVILILIFFLDSIFVVLFTIFSIKFKSGFDVDLHFI